MTKSVGCLLPPSPSPDFGSEEELLTSGPVVGRSEVTSEGEDRWLLVNRPLRKQVPFGRGPEREVFVYDGSPSTPQYVRSFPMSCRSDHGSTLPPPETSLLS